MVKFVFVMALVACVALVAAPVLAETWDISNDWSSTSNPNGAWTVGWSNAAKPPTAGLTAFNSNPYPYGQWLSTLNGWCWDSNYPAGVVFKNISGAALPVTAALMQLAAEPNQIIMFPGVPNSYGTDSIACVVRWTAPRDMAAVIVHGVFTGQQGAGNSNDFDVAVMYNDVAEMSASINGFHGTSGNNWTDATGTVNSAACDTTIYGITAGQTIDFRMTMGAAYTYEEAGLFANITEVSTPEPGSILALGSGLVGLVGFAIRRKRA